MPPRVRFSRILPAALACAALFASPAGAEYRFTLTSPEPHGGARFGDSVAANDKIVAVGAPLDDSDATNAGRVYLFDSSSGAHIATLGNGVAGERFGRSLAMSGDLLLIGIPGHANFAGKALLYDAGFGVELFEIQNPTSDAGDRFGFSVAISGTDILIGAPLDDAVAADVGVAHQFDTVGTHVFTYRPHGTQWDPNDQNGYSVAINGTWAAMGAPNRSAGSIDGVPVVEGGQVLYFAHMTTFPFLNAAGLNDLGHFGSRISFSENQTVYSWPGIPGGGWCYIRPTNDITSFDYTILYLDPPEDGSLHGDGLAISDTYCLTGAPFRDGAAADSGRAYIHDSATGTRLDTLDPPGAATGDEIGSALAIVDDLFAVGAPGTNGGRGAVHIFDAALPFPVELSGFEVD